MTIRTKWVFRLDPTQRLFRVVRFMWERGEGAGTGRGYSAKLSVALDAGLFRWPRREAVTDWMVTACGVRLHYRRSYGGVFA